jgi:hypothetical protein
MPLQNRVTPFGDILAIPQRGLFTGNRGIIHDPDTKTLLTRRWTSKAWLICRCDFRGRRRDVMARRSWTELFFLDEATALAAGHRPCFFCRRDDAEKFRSAWAAAKGGERPTAPQIDAVLHQQRLQRRQDHLQDLDCAITALPDGAVVAANGAAYTILGGMAFRWTESVYESSSNLLTADGVLTPPSTLAAIKAGYRPVIHPSAKSYCLSVAGDR